MYNLIVGMTDGVAFPGRLFEYTDDAVKSQFSSPTGPDLERLLSLPTLLMPEVQNHGGEQAVARVGRLASLRPVGRDLHFEFYQSPHVPAISLNRVTEIAGALGVASEWEWNRTHWAVKDIDLFEVAHEAVGPAKLEPRVFTFPMTTAREPDMVAVMMPFDARFAAVYEAIKDAATDAGFRCHRADDIWDHEHIMDDIISLIWRAQVVVADFTDRNANVFYETGIAHALGRTVIPLTQSMADVPFDLRTVRSLTYLSNLEGLEALHSELTTKLRTLR